MTQPTPEFEALEAEADDVLSALRLSSADAIHRSTAGGITHILLATSERIDELELDLGLKRGHAAVMNTEADDPRLRPDEADMVLVTL